MKLVRQIELIDNIPLGIYNTAKLIEYKLENDKVITKAKAELILDNLSEIESLLVINNINNEIINREVKKIQQKMYNTINFFKQQEILKAS